MLPGSTPICILCITGGGKPVSIEPMENSIQSQQQQVFNFLQEAAGSCRVAAKPCWIPVTEVCHLCLEEQAFSGWTSVMVFFEARNHDT
jgi:hypothetical protein